MSIRKKSASAYTVMIMVPEYAEYSSVSKNLLRNSYSLSGFVKEFTKRCGRFNSPLSLQGVIELKIASAAAKLGIFKSAAVIPQYSIPPNWQILLNYLYAEGIIKTAFFFTRSHSNSLPARYKAAVKARFDAKKSDGQDVSEGATGYGMSSDQEEAYSKALGELLERYFLSTYKKDWFLHSSLNSLTKKKTGVLDLEELNGFLPWQKEKFPGFNCDKDTPLYWAETKELLSNKVVFVPAQLIFWGYKRTKEEPEPFLVHSSTNGAAGHFTFKEAAIKAMYESIERDGFLIYWLNSISPSILGIEAFVDTEVGSLVSELERYGLKVYFLDTTTDIGVPSCICVLLDERGKEPSLSIGGGCGFNIEKTLLSSVYEALSVHNSISEKEDAQEKTELSKDYEPFTSSTLDRDGRLKVWRGMEMLEKFRFFISGPKVPVAQSVFGGKSKTFYSIEKEYFYVLDIFKKMGKGYKVYCYEIKNKVLTKLGYHVVKVVIPQLIPLYLTENLATLDSKRLHEVPEKLGYKDTRLNPWPHPFP